MPAKSLFVGTLLPVVGWAIVTAGSVVTRLVIGLVAGLGVGVLVTVGVGVGTGFWKILSQFEMQQR